MEGAARCSGNGLFFTFPESPLFTSVLGQFGVLGRTQFARRGLGQRLALIQ